MKKVLSVLVVALMLLPSLPSFAQETITNLDETQSTITPRYITTAWVTENNVNFRSAPGLSSTIYRQLHFNDAVLVDYQNNPSVYADGYRWVKASYGSLSGWIADIYLRDF